MINNLKFKTEGVILRGAKDGSLSRSCALGTVVKVGGSGERAYSALLA